MFSTPFVTTSLAAMALLVAAVGPVRAVPPVNVKAVAKGTTHLDHLHLAAHELKHAHSALGGKGGNGGNAQNHLTQAASHLEHAIQHHQSTMNQNQSGLSGALATAAHRHHHNQLHEALHATKEAQKHLAKGKVHEAKKEAERAHHHVEEALRHHA